MLPKIEVQTLNYKYRYTQWWILGDANEAVASGPPFFLGPPLENSIYSFGFAADVCSEDDSE